MPSATARLCKLPGLGVVSVVGDDAEGFLHAQLSQRIRGLGSHRAPLAGWHDARGRVRVLARVLHTGDAWLLITGRAAARSLLEGLGLFVLRSKVALSLPEPDALQAAAIVGEHDEWLGARGIALGSEAGTAVQAEGLHWVRIGGELTQVLGPPAALEALAGDLAPGPEALAELAEIRLGLPAVPPALAGRYVAQMLNLDTLGAVAFDKGCFPGQEVIARAHNLGSVKRRLHRFSAELPQAPAPDSPVIDDAGEPAGEVVRAATWEGRTELLAVVRIEALEDALFTAGAALRPEPLPDDIG